MTPRRRELNIAPDLSLPAEYALEKVAILATTGAGKSNAAVAIAEELHKAGVPWVAVDPKGDWWGVRSSADGQGPGLPVPVFGGEHGDIPLEPTAGKLIARLIAEQRLSCVVDVSDFDTRAQMFRFLRDFAETLLRLNRHPLHVFAEECDDYLPQKTMGEGSDLAKCLGAWQRLVKRGRQKGMGVTMISQRSASVNKDALNMATTLIAMGMNGTADRNAVRDWIVGPGGKPDADEQALLKTLPELQAGEAWLISPRWLGIRQRLHFRQRETFDSGATPGLGEEPIIPATIADIDVAALGSEIAATLEKAKADDPEEMRRELTKLRTQITELEARPPEQAEPTIEYVDRQVLVTHVPPAIGVASDDVRTALAALVGNIRDALLAAEGPVADNLRVLETTIARAEQESLRLAEEGTNDVRFPVPPAPTPATAPPISRPPVSTPVSRTPVAGWEAPRLGAAELKMLAALALFPQTGCTKRRLAAHTGYSAKKSTFRNALTPLRKAGYVETIGDRYHLTPAGLSAGAGLPRGPEGRALIDFWRTELGNDNAERRIFEHLLAQWPRADSRANIAAACGIDLEKSTWRNALTTLGSYDLIDRHGQTISVSHDLMEATQ